jgi:hypothetical protein
LHEKILPEIPLPVPVMARFLGVSEKHAIEAEGLLSVVDFLFKISYFSNLKLSNICLNLLFQTYKEKNLLKSHFKNCFLG